MCCQNTEAIPLATGVAAALEEEKLAQVQQVLMINQRNGQTTNCGHYDRYTMIYGLSMVDRSLLFYS